MELNPDHPRTVPKGWNPVPLGSVGKWLSGGTPSMRNEAYWSGDMPWISPKDMKVLRLTDGVDHISQQSVADGARVAPPGSVLLVVRGMILAHSFPVAVADRSLSFNQDIKAVVPTDRIDSDFLLYWLISNAQRLRSLTTESTHGTRRLPMESLFTEIVLLPGMAEQRKVARAMRDMDALIESLEQLLAKKRHLKQGAMQELLTGKRRLPGFVSRWAPARLDSLADIRSGGTPSTSRADFWDGEVLWCTPTDITALAGHKYLTSTARTLTREGLKNSSAELIPANSVVMTSRATIGECAVNQVPVSTNQGFKNFIPFDGTSAEFLYYLLSTQRQRFIALCGGSTFLEIGKAQLAQFEVRLPADPAEQVAIAAILSDMDTELVALEAKLTKARHIKQGMMQELLTGRIRLV